VADEGSWIHDWNAPEETPPPPVPPPPELDDETLRDGLQHPSAKAPPLQAKREFLHILCAVGIQAADIGMPAASLQALEDCVFLAREVARHRLPLKPNCAARTVGKDVRAVVEISQRAGLAVEVAAFIGCSEARRRVEGWDLAYLRKITRETVSLAVKAGLPVMYVTEDSTRTSPEVLRDLFLAAIESGARRICAADTAGHALPHGAARLVGFLKQVAAESGEKVAVDWHGHMDRGMGLACSLAAWKAGAARIHGSALGLGERVGNTPLDLLIVNLKMEGAWPRDPRALSDYVAWTSRWTGVPVPWNYPVFSPEAFRTGTGVHASALLKARQMGDAVLEDHVYSSVPAAWFGRRQTIAVGPMSGDSNIVAWLLEHREEVTEERVAAIRALAKKSDSLLSDDEIRDALQRLETP